MSDREKQFQRLLALAGDLVGSRGKTVADLGGCCEIQEPLPLRERMRQRLTEMLQRMS